MTDYDDRLSAALKDVELNSYEDVEHFVKKMETSGLAESMTSVRDLHGSGQSYRVFTYDKTKDRLVFGETENEALLEQLGELRVRVAKLRTDKFDEKRPQKTREREPEDPMEAAEAALQDLRKQRETEAEEQREAAKAERKAKADAFTERQAKVGAFATIDDDLAPLLSCAIGRNGSTPETLGIAIGGFAIWRRGMQPIYGQAAWAFTASGFTFADAVGDTPDDHARLVQFIADYHPDEDAPVIVRAFEYGAFLPEELHVLVIGVQKNDERRGIRDGEIAERKDKRQAHLARIDQAKADAVDIAPEGLLMLLEEGKPGVYKSPLFWQQAANDAGYVIIGIDEDGGGSVLVVSNGTVRGVLNNDEDGSRLREWLTQSTATAVEARRAEIAAEKVTVEDAMGVPQHRLATPLLEELLKEGTLVPYEVLVIPRTGSGDTLKASDIKTYVAERDAQETQETSKGEPEESAPKRRVVSRAELDAGIEAIMAEDDGSDAVQSDTAEQDKPEFVTFDGDPLGEPSADDAEVSSDMTAKLEELKKRGMGNEASAKEENGADEPEDDGSDVAETAAEGDDGYPGVPMWLKEILDTEQQEDLQRHTGTAWVDDLLGSEKPVDAESVKIPDDLTGELKDLFETILLAV